MIKSYKNAFLKRKVLSLCLKRDSEELFLMSEGRVFQSVGAATEKDLAPYVFKLKTYGRLVWLQLCPCNNPSLLTTWTGLSNCLHNIRPAEIFILLFSNLLEDFGSYQFCENMLWQVRASVLSSYWLYVITYTFMMLVSCK